MSSASKEVKILIAFCAVANFINHADRVLLPICIVPMSKRYDWDLSFQGWVLSGFGFGYISSQVLGGSLSIRIGGKRVLLFAVFVWSLATFLTPFFAHFDVIMIITRVGLGLAEGLALPAIFQIFSENVPKEERAKAFSYLVSGGSVGQVVASVICPLMGWQAGFIGFGSVGISWALLWLLFLSRCHSTSHKLPEYTYVPPKSSVHWTEFVSHSSLLAIYTAHFCMNCSNYTIMSWLPTYLDRIFRAKPDEMSLTAFPYACNSIAGVVAGHYADYLINKKSWTTLSVRRIMTTLGLIGPALFTLLFSFSNDVALAVLFISVSMGLCACNSSGHLSNHVDVAPTQASLTFAVSNTLASIPGIVAGPVTATIVQYTGQWRTVFLITSIINLFGASIYMSYSATSQVI
ncbi:sialin-like [Convolutriloba macropyga]|uniref:sialin-like n=1 Tax=Convolutriloba macropyga TaxID=536237 RepID=UPI003F523FC1